MNNSSSPQYDMSDPLQDTGCAMPQTSYQQQYSRMLDDTAPLLGVDGDIACEVACLDMNAEKNQYGNKQRYAYDANNVTR